MSELVIDVIGALGYAGLAGLMFLECVFPPIPSETILPFVGFAAVWNGTLIGLGWALDDAGTRWRTA